MSISDTRLHSFFERHCELVTARDLEGLAQLFRTPQPVYFMGGMKVMASDVALRAALQNVFNAMNRHGIVRAGYRILETSERDGHFATLHDFLYYDVGGTAVRSTRMRYFLDSTEFQLKVAMCEYIEAAFPDVLSFMKERPS